MTLRLPGTTCATSLAAPASLALLARQTLQRLALDSHGKPLLDDLGSEGLVEPDGRSVPVEDLPLEASAVLVDGKSRQMREQALADSLAAELRTHEEVFEVQAWAAEPGGVVIKEQGEAGGPPIPLRDDDAELGLGAEAVSREVCLCRRHCLRLALVGGEFADEFKDQPDVTRGSRSDVQHRKILSGEPLLDGPLR